MKENKHEKHQTTKWAEGDGDKMKGSEVQVRHLEFSKNMNIKVWVFAKYGANKLSDLFDLFRLLILLSDTLGFFCS